MKYISKSLIETGEIAENFLGSLRSSSGATVVALSGDLGSGKTTFAQALGQALGVTESIQSPTFVIEKIYDIDFKNFRRLIHIDAYRLEGDKELLHLGWEEITKEPENLILIEWPENVRGIIPEDAKTIRFRFVDEHTREISYD
ncbi:MAG: tRNA (adenosine(37)-N6)-threonylcarbamoyltransferase complex ATPase subunit type 1 TsaE [Minisyncoccia bacterium]